MNPDIKSIQEVLAFGYQLWLSGKAVIGPPLNLANLPAQLIPLYTTAVPAFEDINGVLPELESLSPTDVASLVAFIVSKGEDSAKAQAIITQSLNCAIAAYQLVKAITAK